MKRKKTNEYLIKKLPLIPAKTLEDEIDPASLEAYEKFSKKYKKELERESQKHWELSQKMYALNAEHIKKVVELKPKVLEPMYWETNSSTTNYDIYICVKVAQKKRKK